MQLLTLRENETVLLNASCDLWSALSQQSGVVELTQQRLAFRYKALLGAAKDNVIEVELQEIASATKCNVGPAFIKFLPTGVKVLMKNGDKYIFSLMKRNVLLKEIVKAQAVRQ